MTSFKADSDNVRLDIFLAGKIPRLSRAFIQKLTKEEKVLVNNVTVKPGHKLRVNDVVKVDYDLAALDDLPVVDLPIIYEDENCIVVDKPTGILSHGRGILDDEPTVSNFIREKVPSLTGLRGGIVHRLDRSTSGVMICAKSTEALAWLQKQFATRHVTKTYIALVEGRPKAPEAIIDMPIGRNPKQPALFRASRIGKPSSTHYKVIDQSKTKSLLALTPKTGRTHQLRVHLSHIGHPIVGDTFYGGAAADRLYLHALRLEITLPNQVGICFRTSLPESFYNKLDNDRA
jgi:23S rRNA pseudouridine1911/1915/1917 synthase